jgi:hypothetical protein
MVNFDPALCRTMSESGSYSSFTSILHFKKRRGSGEFGHRNQDTDVFSFLPSTFSSYFMTPRPETSESRFWN